MAEATSSITYMGITITDQDLAQSAKKFRRELLMMPMFALSDITKHMSTRLGIRGKEVVGQLGGNFKFGPYDAKRRDTGKIEITPRELETFLGSAVENFDPRAVFTTVYGESLAAGDKLTSAFISRRIVEYLTGLLGEKLHDNFWTAKRNPTGTDTDELFNGLDTIAAKEIADGKISKEEGNLFVMPEEITAENAMDALKEFYWSASPKLRQERTKLMMPEEILRYYEEDYQSIRGSAPFNTKYEKTILEGTNGKCELVPLASKSGSQYLQLAPKGNLLVGFDQAPDTRETIDVGKYDPLLLTFTAVMAIGTEYESISPERLHIAQLAGATKPEGE